MVKKALVSFAYLLLLWAPAAVADPEPGLITGTFFKGPAVGGSQRFIRPDILLIRGEQGDGRITGGVLTGPATYHFKEEILDFTAQIGTFDLIVTITRSHGSFITLSLVGFTTGVTPTASTVTVTGTWAVLAATGHDAGLKGEGQFTGTENFTTGETQGTFVGLVHYSRLADF
jgi:hypothetical protein